METYRKNKFTGKMEKVATNHTPVCHIPSAGSDLIIPVPTSQRYGYGIDGRTDVQVHATYNNKYQE